MGPDNGACFRKLLLRGIAVLPSAAAETSCVSTLASSVTQLSKMAAPTLNLLSILHENFNHPALCWNCCPLGQNQRNGDSSISVPSPRYNSPKPTCFFFHFSGSLMYLKTMSRVYNDLLEGWFLEPVPLYLNFILNLFLWCFQNDLYNKFAHRVRLRIDSLTSYIPF